MSVPDRSDYVLIVDDAKFMRLLLGKIINAYGYNVKTVPSGYEALREVEKRPPILIFLDLNLPGNHGTEVCQAFRQVDSCKNIPIIICTAQQTREMVQLSKAQGRATFCASLWTGIMLASA